MKNPQSSFRFLLLCVLVAVLGYLTGCAATPDEFTFKDVPSTKQAQMEVVLVHRIAEAPQVAATCAWRNRVAGNGVVKMHPTSPACSWRENGQRIVLCTNPKSFNNKVALEACGHEAFHWHEIVDHP